MESSRVFEATEATFAKDVIERSRSVPVVVDFWAAWCGPCRALTPVLERLVDEAGGAWILAKVDVDANPRLAAAAGVQGIPAVRAFKDGKQVAEFVGALPEPDVRRWLQKLEPSEADLAYRAAAAREAEGDIAAALTGYRRVLALEPARRDAAAAVARLELAERTSGIDAGVLRSRVEADPLDVDAALALSDAEMQGGAVEPALARLVELLRLVEDDDRERVRRHLLELLATLAVDDSRAVAARKSLSSVLF